MEECKESQLNSNYLHSNIITPTSLQNHTKTHEYKNIAHDAHTHKHTHKQTHGVHMPTRSAFRLNQQALTSVRQKRRAPQKTTLTFKHARSHAILNFSSFHLNPINSSSLSSLIKLINLRALWLQGCNYPTACFEFTKGQLFV